MVDLGCGSGQVALRLAPDVARVVAVDISPSMIGLLSENAARAGLENVTGRVTALEQFDMPPGSVDLVVSPLVNGGNVLGGVDPDTGMTYGFDPRTGEPERGRHTAEAEVFGGLLQALKVDTSGSGLPDMPSMRRG